MRSSGTRGFDDEMLVLEFSGVLNARLVKDGTSGAQPEWVPDDVREDSHSLANSGARELTGDDGFAPAGVSGVPALGFTTQQASKGERNAGYKRTPFRGVRGDRLLTGRRDGCGGRPWRRCSRRRETSYRH
jgi:hypothetical protein